MLARDLTLATQHSPLSSVYFRTGHPHLSKIIPSEAQRALRALIGRRITISSAGKQLVIHGGGTDLIMHLGMTGQFRLAPVPREYRQHHFLSLTWDTAECCFIDFRRFARVRLESPNRRDALGGYVPGAGLVLRNAREITRDLARLPGYQSVPRISWLLRHGYRTGVGNYLANEALGRLGLSPFEPCLDGREALQILRKCQELAKQSYREGGTSFGIGYFRLDGSKGRFSERFSFYKHPATKRTLFQNRGVYSDFSPPTSS